MTTIDTLSAADEYNVVDASSKLLGVNAMEDQTRNICNGLTGGVVNVLTEGRVVFQGQIVTDTSGSRKPFIPSQNNGLNGPFLLLELRCSPSFIVDNNARLRTIDPPLFESGDIIRIRLSEIVAIGPGTGCPTNSED